MRLGVCGRKFPEAARLGPERVLDRVAELGFEGVFFRSILDLDPGLDPHHLRGLRARADDHGLYLEVGQRNPAREEHTRQRKSVVDGDLIIRIEPGDPRL